MERWVPARKWHGRSLDCLTDLGALGKRWHCRVRQEARDAQCVGGVNVPIAVGIRSVEAGCAGKQPYELGQRGDDVSASYVAAAVGITVYASNG